MDRRISAFAVAGLASIGAGAVHATAAGMHAEHELLARLFVATAAAQVLVGALVLLRAGRLTAIGTALVNGAAVVAWAVTRVADISWIGGLEQAEAPQFVDTACAALGVIATIAAVLALRPAERTVRTGAGIIAPAVAVAAVTVAAMLTTASHVHSHGESATDLEHTAEDSTAAHEHGTEAGTETAVHAHGDDAAAADHDEHAEETTAHDHTDDATPAQAVAAAAWPRPWDPTQPIDFSGVPGVTPEQQARAETLVRSTLEQLPQFADVSTLPPLGYRSIGDSVTGHEHYINMGYILDDAFLDPSRPESLVYAVNGDQRTLVSAMFIAKDQAVDDPALVDFGGGLMQWHVHENLCWGLNDAGEPVVVGLTDADGNCAPPSVHAGGDNPMVHVWIAPHECGPFAALEGHGAGQAAGNGARVDQCAHEGHDGHDAATASAAVAPVPYDPTKPIDLSGVEGVTPEQQAYAENLVAVTVMRLPQWSDPAVAEAAGFHSIGDAATGHEHYVQWDWIDDDVWLDPDAPESLVYEPQPDGSKKLVSAMYMLPRSVALADVPDNGGALMQWHIHDNLCYTDDPVAPQVAGLIRPDGTCRPPLVADDPAAMIHVWITPHECGPFAALEGVGAGTVPEGEERLCDHAHGS